MNYPSDNVIKKPKELKYLNGLEIVTSKYLVTKTKGINRKIRKLNKWTNRYTTSYKRFGIVDKITDSYIVGNKILMHPTIYEKLKEAIQ